MTELEPVDEVLRQLAHCWRCEQDFVDDEWYCLTSRPGHGSSWATCVGCAAVLACDSENPPLGQ